MVFDEFGNPLGTIKLPPGVELDDIDIMDSIIPFGKPNPVTGDLRSRDFAILAILVLGLLLCGIRLHKAKPTVR